MYTRIRRDAEKLIPVLGQTLIVFEYMETLEAFKLLVDYFKKGNPDCQIYADFGNREKPSAFYFGSDFKRLDISYEFLRDSKTPDELITRLEKARWKRMLDSVRDGQKVSLTNAGIQSVINEAGGRAANRGWPVSA